MAATRSPASSFAHEEGSAVALAERFSCPVIAQVEVRGWLSTQGLSADISQSPNKGGTVRVGDVRVTLTDANHSSSRSGSVSDSQTSSGLSGTTISRSISICATS